MKKLLVYLALIIPAETALALVFHWSFAMFLASCVICLGITLLWVKLFQWFRR